jgi:hypothetical protein
LHSGGGALVQAIARSAGETMASSLYGSPPSNRDDVHSTEVGTGGSIIELPFFEPLRAG